MSPAKETGNVAKAKAGRAARPQSDEEHPPDENSMRARKRAMDREAQRNFRAKTKSYIAHLEQTIKACEADSESQRVAQLLAENERLYDTLKRMRRILNDIFTAIQPELLRQNLSTICEEEIQGAIEGSNQQQAAPKPQAATTKSKPPQPQIQYDDTGTPCPETSTAPIAAPEQLMPDATPTSTLPPNDMLNAFTAASAVPLPRRGSAEDEISAAEDSQIPGQHQFAHNTLVMLADMGQHPFDPQSNLEEQKTHPTRLTLPRNPSTFCFWAHANIIYSQIFTITPSQASAVISSDRNLLFKAIKCGWQSLELECNHNIVLRILKCYDELVMGAFEPIDRLAIAYKNYVLIQYFLKRDFSHLLRVPEWQRPGMFSAIAGKYPLLVDFFPWPGLREKIINGKLPMDQSFFGRCFLSNFRFAWPFNLEDTYQYCAASDVYLPTPMFERYHQDLRFWTMGESFFWQFPQLVEDIGLYND